MKWFKYVIYLGRWVQHPGNKLDGLKAWTMFKQLLLSRCENTPVCSWNLRWKINEDIISNIEKLYDYVHNDLGMHGDDNDEGVDFKHEQHHKWELYHFVLQLVRIPKNNDCNILRLCQIAYNIGQAQSNMKSYSLEVQNFIKANRLDKMSSYVDKKFIDNKDTKNQINKEVKQIIKYIIHESHNDTQTV